VHGLGFKVWSLECRVKRVRFRVNVLGLGFQGIGFRVRDPGFKV
jgi:hypothetical protein